MDGAASVAEWRACLGAWVGYGVALS